MALEKLGHPLQLIAALSRVGEERIVPASFTVRRLDTFVVRSQGHLELTRQAKLGVRPVAIRRAMHKQDRQTEFRGTLPGSQRVTRRMKNGRLHVPVRQQVLERGFSGTAGVTDESEPIGPNARKRTRRLHQRVDELHCFRIIAGPQGRNIRTGNRRRYLTRTSASAALEPASGDDDEATARQVVGPFHVLAREAVRAVQHEDGGKRSRT